MQAIEATRRRAVTVERDATITAAAELMNAHAIGALVVVDGADRPVGIVTDRDLVVRAMARGLPAGTRVDTVMTTPPVTMPAAADLRDAIRLFRDHAFRRLPLVDGERVVGMVTVDDLFIDLTADLADLVRPVTGEVLFGHPEPATPAGR